MPLSPGDKLGQFDVLSLLGKGGMGEVYRARDTQLKREVALKVLPAVFSSDPERLARFQREAELLASLDHPNIGHIHGMVQSERNWALVLALIEGPTLADRIKQGPLPPDEAIAIAKQIIDALEYAHEHGVIHRDLKPANIKVTPDGVVKVLDFGLAKALDQRRETSLDPENSPTLTMGATQAGVIMGTAAYMSPEQAVGKAADRRSDIFSLGVVLYEMLTGQRPFRGESMGDTLAAVVKDTPDWSALPEGTPSHLRKLLERMLVKDRKERLQAIGEARISLKGGAESPVQAASLPQKPSKLPWAMTAVAVVGALALGVGLWQATRPVEQALVRANLDLPGYVAGDFGNVALSADGTRIAYVTRGEDGKDRLATRLLAESEPKSLAGTEGARLPFFSPDGQWIGFGADGQVKKVLALGGAPLKLADAPLFLGGSWGDEGFIVATVNAGTYLMRIPEAGGAAEALLPPGPGSALVPQVLPGGKKVILGGSGAQGPEVQILNLETKKVSTLIPGATFARYLPTNGATSGATGHLVYPNGSTLMAAPFDLAAGELRGPAIPVLDEVAGLVGFSSTGDALYAIGAASQISGWPLRWLRPDGKTEPLLEAAGSYSFPRVSPDGKLLAVTVDNERAAESRMLVYDWQNDRTLPLTEKGQGAGGAVWTPDSRYVIWATPLTSGKRRFLWKRADGSGEVHTLVESATYVMPTAISPDGKFLAFHASDPKTTADVLVAPLDLSQPEEIKLGEPQPLVRLPGLEGGAVFSPDGKWVAYLSDESGQFEVYVQRFPGGGGHRKVSDGTGIWPKWSSNGRQLLYSDPMKQHIMAVDYQGSGDAFVAGKPHEWSATPVRQVRADDSWGLDPKGERAVVIPVPDAPANAGPPKVAYLLHFFDELRRKVPVGK